MRGCVFFTFLFILTSCGGSSKDTDPKAVQALNQACIEGQISGEFIAKLEDGSFEKISAASSKHFLRKIKKMKLKVHSFEHNFKVISEPVLSRPDNTTQKDDFSEGPKFINADFLWAKGFTGSGAVTALIDSGYDFSHSLLQGTVLENTNDFGDDEDENGYKNDRFGWDSFNNKGLSGDLGSHGTQVGSVIAAAHRSGVKFGVAPDSKIIPIAALQPDLEKDTEASGDSNSIISALDYALTRKVNFINASWGGDLCSNFIRERIKKATDSGIVFVTSAGNSSADLNQKIAFPASLPFANLLTIGSSKPDQSREPNSNYGNVVDFFALGQDVIVASPQNLLGTVTGTSVAAPFVTGGLALLKSAFPEASNEALVQALDQSKNTQKIPDLEKAFLLLQQL